MSLKQSVDSIFRAIPLRAPWFVVLALANVGLPARADFIVASYTPTIRNDFFATNSPSTHSSAQTFTPIAGGTLNRVSLLLFTVQIIPPPVALPISIFATADGLPTTVLATTSISIPPLQIPSNFSIDFSFANLNLTPGTLYAIVVGAPPSGGYGWQGDGPGTYTGGEFLMSNDSGASWLTIKNHDLGFSVTVVPEPSAVLLLISSVVIGSLSRRART